MRQVLVVLGDPFYCWQCKEVATVMIGMENEDKTHSSVCFCDNCWVTVRQGYSPLTARDEQQAVEAAKVILGDDDQKQPAKVV